mmetsp:Transcript_292/g.700  ORF Transcript_292/g.700 Transcript_292/m.700 type:complete len:96 (+) Transcript_292:90-377(+)
MSLGTFGRRIVGLAAFCAGENSRMYRLAPFIPLKYSFFFPVSTPIYYFLVLPDIERHNEFKKNNSDKIMYYGHQSKSLRKAMLASKPQIEIVDDE